MTDLNNKQMIKRAKETIISRYKNPSFVLFGLADLDEIRYLLHNKFIEYRGEHPMQFDAVQGVYGPFALTFRGINEGEYLSGNSEKKILSEIQNAKDVLETAGYDISNIGTQDGKYFKKRR